MRQQAKLLIARGSVAMLYSQSSILAPAPLARRSFIRRRLTSDPPKDGLIRSQPALSPSPLGFKIYVAIPQLAPFAVSAVGRTGRGEANLS